MSITLDGTNGITTPDVTSSGALNVNASAPDDSLVVDASGRLFVNATSNTETAQLFVSGTKTLSSGIPLNQLGVADSTALASGIGGAINFIGTYTSGGSQTSFASIEASKDNGTSGDFGAAMVFKTRQNGGAQIERARIDSSGNLLVGTTSVGGVGHTISGGSLPYHIINNSNGASGQVFMSFRRNGVEVGYIAQNGTTAVSYSTTSDYRLKNTIAPMTGALAKVAALKPCTYKWNADGSDGEGFIAHELQAVCPHAVTGEKDAVDADGNPVYQGIDTSFLVATLTAAIQEQQAIIEEQKTALEAQQQAIAGLTARVEALEANNV